MDLGEGDMKENDLGHTKERTYEERKKKETKKGI